MSHKDILHQAVISDLLEGSITLEEAAQRCGLSTRQVHRLRKKAQEEGIDSICHGNLGRKPVHAVTPQLEERITELYLKEYSDHNFTHFSDIIIAAGVCSLSRSTIYRVLVDAGISPSGKRRRSKIDHK